MTTERDYFIEHIIPLKNKLFRKALFMTGQVEDAEDIVQDVMITLWNKRAGWKEIKNMEVYAMVLTKNLSIDRMKNMAGKCDSIEGYDERFLHHDHKNPLEDAIQKDERMLVWKILDQLSENQKKMVILRDINQHSYAQIAEMMETTEAQVKINLYRARQRIRVLYLKIDKNGLY